MLDTTENTLSYQKHTDTYILSLLTYRVGVQQKSEMGKSMTETL